MWWNKKRKLQRLSDELRAIAILDRLYADKADLTSADRYAQARRQIRQSELVTEIEELTAKKRPGITIDEQKPAPSGQEISAQAAREQDPARLLARLEKLKRALDERKANIRRDEEPAAA